MCSASDKKTQLLASYCSYGVHIFVPAKVVFEPNVDKVGRCCISHCYNIYDDKIWLIDFL